MLNRTLLKMAPPLLALCTWQTFGCSGNVADGQAEDDGGPGDRGGSGGRGTGGRGGATAANPNDPFAGGSADAAGPMPLRRLSNEELDFTLADLLGDTSTPGRGFPTEAKSEYGFYQPIKVGQIETTRYRDAAEDVASSAMAKDFAKLAPCPSGTGEEACATQFIERFGLRAFRRPLDATERALLLALYKRDRAAPVSDDHKGALTVVLQAMLQSPQFLYHWTLGAQKPVVEGTIIRLTPYEVASRLSYLLWRSLPDEALLEAAASGKLSTSAQVAAQVDRMVNDGKIKRALVSFYSQTMDVARLQGMAKDTAIFPGYNAALTEAMAKETAAFVAYAALEGGGLEALLTAPVGFANEALAAVYGVKGLQGAELRRIDLDPQQRSGLFTQASFLTVHASTFEPSPVLRGKVVLERLLCRHVPPPADVDTMVPAPQAGKTTRERFEAHSSNAACAGCHKELDPLGFSFEHYDAIGGWRDEDAGRPVNASGNIQLDGEDLAFKDARQLFAALSKSADVRACATRQWLRFATGRGDDDADLHSLSKAHAAFGDSDWDLRALLAGLAKSPILTVRTPAEGEVLQ